MHESFIQDSKIDPAFRHHCQPDSAPGGMYRAHVVVQKLDGSHVYDVKVTPPGEPFATARAAADAAYAEGERWVERWKMAQG
jgi:hypothetical protein